MYRSGPASPGDGQDGLLRLSRAARGAFGTPASSRDRMLRSYLSDMVAPYHLRLHDEVLDSGEGQSYGEMAGTLLAQTVLADEPVDLLVLAFAVHDVVPGRSTAAYLSHLCPGRPTAFAVCDQGAAAPFSALRLICAYTGTGSCRRALLVVVEQASLPYDLLEPAAVPARNAAVTLLFGESGPGSVLAVREYADVDPAGATEALAGEIAALSVASGALTVIAGNGLAGHGEAACEPGPPARLPADLPAGTSVLLAPAGQPCTGAWWELAGSLARWTASGRQVLLADYEPALGYLCVAAIGVAAGRVTALPRLTSRRAQ